MTLFFDNKYLHMKKSKYFWLLDAGHGGIVHSKESIVDSKTTTKARRILKPELERMGYHGHEELWDTKSFVFNENQLTVDKTQLIIHEGLINRKVINKLYPQLEKLQIDFGLVHDEVEDMSLGHRVRIADNVHRKYGNVIFVSIHSDKLSLSRVPYPTRHEDFVQLNVASGASVWTSKGRTKSDKVANIFVETGMRTIPNLKWRTDRSDGDLDQEADFYVLKKTDCPAILCETGFYDNPKEAAWLSSEQGQTQYAEYLLQSILMCEKLKPI